MAHILYFRRLPSQTATAIATMTANDTPSPMKTYPIAGPYRSPLAGMADIAAMGRVSAAIPPEAVTPVRMRRASKRFMVTTPYREK